MKILKFPDKALLTPCIEVTQFGPELKVILDSMFKTMIDANGMGLAANQVGLSIRAFVMLGFNGGCVYVINPEIVDRSSAISNILEGCLSAPGERISTNNRSSWVRVKFQDLEGAYLTFTFEGIQAVCAQHEIQHINGQAFFQAKTIPKAKRQEICKRWGLKAK